MYYDKDSTLYVATKGGLIIIDTETQAYNIYAEAAASRRTICSLSIRTAGAFFG